MSSSPPLAELRNVRFRYGARGPDLLEDVNLTIRAGEVVILAGPNGSGKSTLLGLLAGRLSPSSGLLRVFGRNPATVSRAPDMGLITEPFHPEQSPLPVDLSLRRILAWLRILDCVTAAAMEQRCNELGIREGLLDQPVRRLSKGERQRVMLLIVLLRRPRFLLADEPLEGLDRHSRRLMGGSLRRFTQRTGSSVLWVSHHLAETLSYADRLLEIEGNTIVERPADRFEVRVCAPRRPPTTVSLGSLHGLASLVEQHLDGDRALRLEIRDTETRQARP